MTEIKDITEEDFDDILKMTKKKSIMKFIGDGKVWDEKKVEKFIDYNLEEQNQRNRKNYYYKIVSRVRGDTFIGIIGAHEMKGRKGFYLTIMIEKEHQRKGYYGEGLQLLKDKLKRERIKTDHLKSLVRKSNKRMNEISMKRYYFNREVIIRREEFNEYFIFLRKYTYSINISREENKIASKILEKRGNWKKYNFSNKRKEIDFVYIYGKNRSNRGLYDFKTLLKNLTIKEERKFTNKNLLFQELEKIKDSGKYLVKNYYINLKKIDMVMIKKLFKKHKVLIFKPVHGWSGYGIKIFENFDDFKNYISSEEFKISIEPIENVNLKKVKKNSLNDWVLQEYIDDPMLDDGKKFHIRGYYLIYKNEKYLFKEGRIYPARKKYKKADYYNTEIHDTHSPIDSDIVAKDYPKDLKLSKKIKDNIQKQIEYLFHLVGRIDDYYFRCYEESKKCFEIFGFDIMITKDYQVKMIEVNPNPGLPSLEKSFGKKLFEDQIKLIVDKTFPPKNKIDEENGFIRVY
jgi:RimJ/RimL family protein N-acetyltransferase